MVSDFVRWTYDNHYFYSHSNLQNKYGWLTYNEIREIGNMTERDKLRRSTTDLFNEFLEKRKTDE